jgi:hypothetical protein
MLEEVGGHSDFHNLMGFTSKKMEVSSKYCEEKVLAHISTF